MDHFKHYVALKLWESSIRLEYMQQSIVLIRSARVNLYAMSN
jgi:hypothetical protein